MSTDPAIEKIKKLLRLGKSSNPHEAELALQRAFEIAEKNHIDLANLDVDDDLKKIALKAHRVALRLSYPKKLAISTVQSFFNVTVLMKRGQLEFIGTAADIEVGIHVFEFLVRACNRDLLKIRARMRGVRLPRKHLRSFVNGFFYGVSSNLTTLRQETLIAHEQYALVLQAEDKRRDAFITANCGKVKNVEIYDTKALDKNSLTLGYRMGREVQISQPLPCNTARLALMGGAL